MDRCPLTLTCHTQTLERPEALDSAKDAPGVKAWVSRLRTCTIADVDVLEARIRGPQPVSPK
ncbi:MAG TPA: hypothetical protein VE981_16545 [Planctomycetota bacterium]|nr:hypothetical protein [Planctomycetota bacterium]